MTNLENIAAADIAWIDEETNGLDTRLGCKLIQIAVVVTDKNFNELGTIEAKFYYTPEEVKELRDAAVDFVKNMHDATGLWEALSDESNPRLEDFDETLLAWLKELQPEAGVLRFGGNSIFLDREFMREFLPKSYAHLSYRSVDMTSVEYFLMNTDHREGFEKKLTHEALEDIRESIAQARYHRELSVVPF